MRKAPWVQTLTQRSCVKVLQQWPPDAKLSVHFPSEKVHSKLEKSHTNMKAPEVPMAEAAHCQEIFSAAAAAAATRALI